MSQLKILDLSNNKFSGSLPADFSPSSLAIVSLSKNRLQGSVKNAFYSCRSLFQLDLSHNNFSGRIPPWIGELSQLSFLVLGYNNLQGEIPTELCKLKQLSFIDLSHINISGHMLHCLNFTSYWSREQSIIGLIENIEITMKGRTYQYEEKVLRYVSGIDVSSNYLTGKIPVEIGDLTSIKTLNLSENCFRGTIPPTFSNLNEIESLDLSYNNLQGTLPPQLPLLTSLAVFNVSYNNLSGKTPNQVRQFATFDESSYRGNPFLCGWPLSKICGTQDSTQSHAMTGESNNEIIDMDDFFISFCVAYAMVLLTLVAVLCINPYWRRVWFYYIQLSIDKTF